MSILSGDSNYDLPSSSNRRLIRPRRTFAESSESDVGDYINVIMGPKRQCVYVGRNASVPITNQDESSAQVEAEVESQEPYHHHRDLPEEDEEEEEEENNELQQVDTEQETESTPKETVITLTEPDVFDCPICCEPLTIPVYQCDENGHIACSSCCTKISNNKCPSCNGSIQSNRCRAIEKVLEAMTTPCPNSDYGCAQSVTYSKRLEHQKSCEYAPCYCPESNCNFASTAKDLYRHFYKVHEDCAEPFKYYNNFSVTVNNEDDGDYFLVLQETNDGTLFLLNAGAIEEVGTGVWVTCVQPEGFTRDFCYEVVVSKGEFSSIRLQSCTKNTPNWLAIDDTPKTTDFLLIPFHFYSSSDNRFDVDLCIRPKIGNCA